MFSNNRRTIKVELIFISTTLQSHLIITQRRITFMIGWATKEIWAAIKKHSFQLVICNCSYIPMQALVSGRSLHLSCNLGLVARLVASFQFLDGSLWMDMDRSLWLLKHFLHQDSCYYYYVSYYVFLYIYLNSTIAEQLKTAHQSFDILHTSHTLVMLNQNLSNVFTGTEASQPVQLCTCVTHLGPCAKIIHMNLIKATQYFPTLTSLSQ